MGTQPVVPAAAGIDPGALGDSLPLAASASVNGAHKNTASPTYGAWFTFGNAVDSMGGARTGTPAEGYAPLVAYVKWGDVTGGSNAPVTKTTQTVSFVGAYYGPTVDDSAECASAAVLLKDTGTGFTQGKKVTAFEADVQIEGSNNVTGAGIYILGQGSRIVMAGPASNADLAYGVKVSATTFNNTAGNGTVGTWKGFFDEIHNPGGTSRDSSLSVHGANRVLSEQSLYASRSGYGGFVRIDLAGSDDSNSALVRIQQPSPSTTRTVTDGAMMSGSRVLASATLATIAADVSKKITVAGAGVAGATLTSIVMGYLVDGSAVLNTAASTTVVGASVTMSEPDLVGIRIKQGTGGTARAIETYDSAGAIAAGLSRTGAWLGVTGFQVINTSFVVQCSLGPAGLQTNTATLEATGVGAAALGANCPAVTATAPYTWMKAKTSDGSVVYIPVWK